MCPRQPILIEARCQITEGEAGQAFFNPAVQSEEAQPTEISSLAQGLDNLQATVASLQETITKSHTLVREEARPPTNQGGSEDARPVEKLEEETAVTTATGAGGGGEKTTWRWAAR